MNNIHTMVRAWAVSTQSTEHLCCAILELEGPRVAYLRCKLPRGVNSTCNLGIAPRPPFHCCSHVTQAAVLAVRVRACHPAFSLRRQLSYAYCMHCTHISCTAEQLHQCSLLRGCCCCYNCCWTASVCRASHLLTQSAQSSAAARSQPLHQHFVLHWAPLAAQPPLCKLLGGCLSLRGAGGLILGAQIVQLSQREAQRADDQQQRQAGARQGQAQIRARLRFPALQGCRQLACC